MRDGRYGGGNSEISLDLRVDEQVAGVISMDVYRNGAGQPQYVASLRTNPGVRIKAADGEWPIIAQDELGAQVTGRLTLAPAADSAEDVLGAIVLDGRLNGLASRRAMGFSATWDGSSLRTVGIEVETEHGVAPIAPHRVGGQDVTLESCFAEAGISVETVGRPSPIPPARPEGWGTAQLHALMTDLAQAPLARSVWQLHLLLLSRSTREGLLGVMFDEAAPLPRQGAAVFAGAIRDFMGSATAQSLIQTCVHELGHALNLAHRFEREVARADSLSFMNYDWRFRGGGREIEFWSRFAFAFDADELEFLRHAPRNAIIPGGATFHSIDYWTQGDGDYAPNLPAEVTLSGVTLELRAPPAAVQPAMTGSTALFRFGQPIFLEVRLTNTSGSPIEVHPSILDVKTGLLDVLVKRVRTGTSGTLLEARPFIPIMQRCFALAPSMPQPVAHGESIRNNVNLTYGAGGFAFAEPGVYEVTAVVTVPDVPNQREMVVRSPSLRIRVAHPATAEEESDAMNLFDDEVGTYLVLGGTAALPVATDRLETVRERRGAPTDPVVAAIVRAMGINAGRSYCRFEGSRYRETEGDSAESARLLESLDETALQAFDEFTANETRKLAVERRDAAR